MAGEELACFYHLVQRTVSFDGQPVAIVGLHNLIATPAYRSRGFASRLLEPTEAMWFDELAANYGLLLCADPLVSFYAKLGWQHLSAEVRFMQPEAPARIWAANCMLLHPASEHADPDVIDLCGLPW